MDIVEINESHFEKLISLFKEFAIFEKLPELMINSVDKMKAEKDLFKGFVAVDKNDDIVGYTVFFFAYYTWTGKTLYMDDLYVCESHRSKGLGTRLINKVIEYARSENCTKMRWQVSNWNATAIKFYENLGATINHVERNCDLIL
ncbi:GNAT family N-acetyltransferase [Dysgonomonas sp. 520]|uniref:GNAT family N-acetyltransferase n=1 Tax=Dysgonomonas sp. 520 TaxID=2302931 RepID=UPI0013D256E3|nr:GNAT family N-acetyltransferase [Dysgonomonas sp. 520]NDW09088.1 GNAT family N-acetyltransferase [Dysgonomonas sp. 520]